MHVAELTLTNFRSYRRATFRFAPRLNLIIGENASGKTNLLEGAYYALRAASPRTSRDDKVVRWGEQYARADARLQGGPRVQVFYGVGQGKRVLVNGVDAAALDEVRRLAPVFIFVPESLLLVKGSPARRRAHVDALGAALDPAYQAAAADLQLALRQRNAQLASVRAGAPEATLDPWDAQLADSGVVLGRLRRTLVERLAPPFASYAAALAPGGGRFALVLRSSLEGTGYERRAYLEALRRRRAQDVQRAVSTSGPHRDDIEFLEVGSEGPAAAPVESGGERRDLRQFGSQGEQRAAVLALLLAERAVAAEVAGDLGALFLDDVMSELDERRRRLLVAVLSAGGQSVVTSTTTMYFTPEELATAHVIELGGGASSDAVADEAGAAGAEARSPAGEALDDEHTAAADGEEVRG